MVGARSIVDVDASKGGNEARFINDYRNIAARHNVCMKSEAHILTGEAAPACFTERPVRKGEEFLLDYGQQYWDSLKGNQQPPLSEAEMACGDFVVSTWPPELEYTSGFKWDKCVTLPQLRMAHTFRPMQGVHVIRQADGRPGLVAEVDFPPEHVIGVYAGRVGKQRTNERSVPIGKGFYIVECGNETKYLRHSLDSGNVYAQCRNDELMGHLYVALIALHSILRGTELVLNRSIPVKHRDLDWEE